MRGRQRGRASVIGHPGARDGVDAIQHCSPSPPSFPVVMTTEGGKEEEDGSADSKVTSRLQRRLTALFGVIFVDHSVVGRPDSY
ncbi:hypothetical protein CEXT_750491 [Caerostris extrusa]|uniref:Uncharacterized protein n=1 Tax=Caerostris extrusa TaxID=172846 RepID=A0AAV4TQT2_CAEEX|nr:hypothetical protein CEXT_750491 [Caerostris extrusa]